jgi:hypothetical protein
MLSGAGSPTVCIMSLWTIGDFPIHFTFNIFLFFCTQMFDIVYEEKKKSGTKQLKGQLV